MQKFVIISVLATLFFCIFKFMEMKYLDKKVKPLKNVVRDAIVVFISSFVSSIIFFNLEVYISDFFNIVTERKTLNVNATQIFTDEPGF